jgi:patatin-like phospholipase/acyl hydrolase
MFGSQMVSGAIADEVMIVSFSYNVQEPRFYSKLLANSTPKVYDVSMQLAAAAASAMPGFFNPKTFVNGLNDNEMLVDGEIIANNPSMYAYVFASEKVKTTKPIRVVSLGSGANPPPQINPNNVNVFTWLNNLNDLLIDVEVTTHDYFTQFLADDYYRFQYTTS